MIIFFDMEDSPYSLYLWPRPVLSSRSQDTCKLRHFSHWFSCCLKPTLIHPHIPRRSRGRVDLPFRASWRRWALNKIRVLAASKKGCGLGSLWCLLIYTHSHPTTIHVVGSLSGIQSPLYLDFFRLLLSPEMSPAFWPRGSPFSGHAQHFPISASLVRHYFLDPTLLFALPVKILLIFQDLSEKPLLTWSCQWAREESLFLCLLGIPIILCSIFPTRF